MSVSSGGPAPAPAMRNEQAPAPLWRDLPGHRVEFGRDRPLRLDSGIELGPFNVAYQT